MRTLVSPEHKTVRAVCIDVKTLATRLMLSFKYLGNRIGETSMSMLQRLLQASILPGDRLGGGQTSSLSKQMFQAAAQ